MPIYGLLGRDIGYSKSPEYFTKKFKDLGIDSEYRLFDIQKVEHFTQILSSSPELVGLNVTTPYKESVTAYLTNLSEEAQFIGAVNCISIKNQKLIGHNTDALAFKKTLIDNNLESTRSKALIFGSGGVSKAVQYILNELEIKHTVVSRAPIDNQIGYSNMEQVLFDHYDLIINATKLGQGRLIGQSPLQKGIIPRGYQVFYDLNYNKSNSTFLDKARSYNLKHIDGLAMFSLQAELSWNIWNP